MPQPLEPPDELAVHDVRAPQPAAVVEQVGVQRPRGGVHQQGGAVESGGYKQAWIGLVTSVGAAFCLLVDVASDPGGTATVIERPF